MKNLLLLSTSKVHGTNYLQYATNEVKSFFRDNRVNEVLFIPYALKNHDKYLTTVKEGFDKYVGIKVESIHNREDPKKAVSEAQAVFVGGGNTFLLLKTLWEYGLVDIIRKRVLNGELVYMGSSAGTNVATVSICTTNDMPIVYPPTFEALGLVSFNINPHYIEPEVNSKHMGETREKRIGQYHELPGTPPVVGLREGSIMRISNKTIQLYGPHTAKVFIPNESPKECDEQMLNDLLREYL
ncbi:probable alpha-aspartyl dipeptidase [Cimex lectularius]|uniref:dipeptidase E n=1 Tax=Cimex lectularius TaxID=79782 RepID=A0A8I6RRR8_CIMLE|nr:probable alpha-aspartyl dipeptidase [Cimex lectularius]